MAGNGRWSLLIRFGPLLLVAAVIAAVFATGFSDHFTLHELKARHRALYALVQAHPFLGVAAYVALYAVMVGLSLPVALVMTLTGGFLFGPWIGGAAAAVGATLGACVIFLICRTAVGDSLRERGGAKLAKIEDGVRKDAFLYVLSLRLLPVVPFWLVNLGAGLVRIRLRTFFLATLIGILPLSLVYAGLGSGLGKMFRRGVTPKLDVVLEPQILLPLVGMGLLSLAPIVFRLIRRRGAALPAEPG